MKRSILIGSLLLVLCMFSVWVPLLRAQSYPTYPIQLIIPGNPGDGADIAARMFAEEFAKVLNVAVVPLNKPGASGAIAGDFVVKGKKDGYTLLYANTSSVVYGKASDPDAVPYDPVKDLEPLGYHTLFPTVASVRADAPWNNFNELAEYSRKNPDKVRWGTMGVSTIDHVQWEMAKAIAGAGKITMIPFKGMSGKTTALLGGHVEVTSFPLAQFQEHYKAKKIKGILIDHKVPEFPELLTLQELGFKRGIPSPWTAVFAPIGIPEEARKVLIPAIEKAVRNPELMSRMQKLWYIPGYKNPAELRELLIRDYENARATFKQAGVTK